MAYLTLDMRPERAGNSPAWVGKRRRQDTQRWQQRGTAHEKTVGDEVLQVTEEIIQGKRTHVNHHRL